jgi:signal transduction histidine kinase
MKMKNKILLSSFSLMLLSLIALLVIGGFIIRSYSREFSDTGIPRPNQGAFVVEDLLDHVDIDKARWEELVEGLSAQGYEIVILPQYALNNEIQKNLFEVLLRAFVLTGLVSILLLLVISLFFANWLVGRFMRPINALNEGAKRIVEGNLSVPVLYKGKDELSTVCVTFNQMQSHLQEEREKNTLYEKARTDMVAGISHDLRTPLASVKGYIKGLLDGVANTPEKREKYLSIAYNKAGEMDALLQKLFDFSRLETGNLPLSLSEVELSDFIRQYVLHSQDELEYRNTKITAHCASEDCMVQVDKEQMNRVLANLTDNALKYAGVNELLLTLSVWKEEDTVHLCFSDNGKGVPEEDLSNLFQQLWRGDASRSSRDHKGSGLGLSIVKHIIKTHGGSVSARNNNGLTIDIVLPAQKDG